MSGCRHGPVVEQPGPAQKGRGKNAKCLHIGLGRFQRWPAYFEIIGFEAGIRQPGPAARLEPGKVAFAGLQRFPAIVERPGEHGRTPALIAI